MSQLNVIACHGAWRDRPRDPRERAADRAGDREARGHAFPSSSSLIGRTAPGAVPSRAPPDGAANSRTVIGG